MKALKLPTPKKVLVTGAAGFIGSHTVDLLLREGHQVVGIDDLSTGNLDNVQTALKSGRFHLEQADMLDEGLMDRLVAEFLPDAIIHLAGLVSVTLGQEQPERNFRLNLESTKLVAEAARKHGCKRVVFASSAAVYGDLEQLPIQESDPKDPKSNYGTAKLMSEMLLQSYAKSYGMTCISNRFFNVFGPRQDPHSPYSGVISIFAERFSTGREATIFGDGQQSRDFISVYDIAAGNVLAATQKDVPSGAYNLCSGERQSLLDLVDALAKALPTALPVNFAEEREGDIKHSQGSNDKARVYLGFAPKIEFEAGIEDLVASTCESTDELRVA
mgnify:CR=1 FL=1|tara:strand:- start:1427 stop:2416 length:990 start_codon:yes stop_codon:yes gene_type:complete